MNLTGGRSSNEGTVQVYFHAFGWGKICDDGWDLDNAKVVCRMLGYPRAISSEINSKFGKGFGRFILDDVNCVGNESDIANCSHSAWGEHDCSDSEVAGVVCGGKYLFTMYCNFKT